MYMTMDALARRAVRGAQRTRLGLLQGQTTPLLIHALPTWTGVEGCEEDHREEGLVG